MYFTEYQVELFQTVKAGDVIAKVHVENDEAELLEKQLQTSKTDRTKWRMQWKAGEK